jgi:DNA-binding response OmpR family regulator
VSYGWQASDHQFTSELARNPSTRKRTQSRRTAKAEPVAPKREARRRMKRRASLQRLSLQFDYNQMAGDGLLPCVVVVDDDRDSRELYRLVLESAGYRVLDAGSVDAACRLFRQSIPDVVLTDWLLPDGDGHGVCEALYARGASRFVPVVVLSGWALSDAAEAHARERGLVTVLEKPADPDVVLDALRGALSIGIERRVRSAASRTQRYAGQAHRRAAQLRAGAPDTAADASVLLARAAARSGHSISLLIADDNAHYIAAGGATRELTGYDPTEIAQLTVWDLTPVGVMPACLGLWTEFIAQGKQEGRYSLRRRDGQAIDARYCALANIVPGWHLSAIAPLPDMPTSLSSLR